MSGRNQSGYTDQRVTQCKRCNTTIFRFHAYVWQIRPNPGFVHTDCLPGSKLAASRER